MCNKKGTLRFSSGNTRGMTNEGNLPREIWADILTRLPAKMVGQCKCICKHWRAVIEDPSFVELHHFRAKSRADGCHLIISSGDRELSFFSTDYGGGLAQHLFRSPISFDSFFEAPVNGLICGYDASSKSIFIVNPTTKEVITLPPFSLPSSWYSGGEDQTLVAFGFDPSTKQYKVLHISRVKTQSTRGNLEFSHCNSEIFTLGTHSWRKIDVVPPASQFEFGYNGICLGGVIHWKNFTSYGESSRPVDEVVVAFDLKDERFRVISLPRGPSCMPLLVEVGGHLAARQDYPENEPEELWILEDYDTWVWVKERIMLSPTYIHKHGSFQTGEILRCSSDLIHTHGSFQTGEILLHSPLPNWFPVLEVYYYGWKKRSLRKIDIAGIPQSHYMHVFNCVENLLSFRDIFFFFFPSFQSFPKIYM